MSLVAVMIHIYLVYIIESILLTNWSMSILFYCSTWWFQKYLFGCTWELFLDLFMMSSCATPHSYIWFILESLCISIYILVKPKVKSKLYWNFSNHSHQVVVFSFSSRKTWAAFHFHASCSLSVTMISLSSSITKETLWV